ncbi:hypothetical protein RVR_6962 [Actinacidiphila reveromycinica]|uniref:Uncharacterized protein n=1 Tax=Actinacidiphila reveromycinica TaxID=659352 RepID=A0A7U3VQR4_9ACTN|nr:hypothetical protein [Streptomyces sp. SN-593]BBB00071.1 hypothetical protein RVR_6962 [Streptomyces sp. SN-593]
MNAPRPRTPAPAVPYIATWSAEERAAGPLVLRPDGRGIGYPDEVPHDRDAEGVLWMRAGLARGRGKPSFGAVHPARQRRAMRLLLCQVCAGPADRDDDGVLWLLGDDRDDWPGWPEEMGATHPPICRPCAVASLRLCPYLRRGHVAYRVARPRIAGVHGMLFAPPDAGPAGPADRRPVPVGPALVPYGDPLAPWLLAAQLAMELRACTPAPL